METHEEFIPQPQQRNPGFYHALLLIAIANSIFILIGALTQYVISFIPLLSEWFMLISYVITFWLSLILAKNWWQVPRFDVQKTSTIVYLLLIPLVIAMAIIMEGVVSLLPMPESIRLMFEQAMQINFPGYLTLCIAAPLLEELIFRGVVLKIFLKKYSPHLAIVLSAVVFGIAHLNPWQFIAAFSIGLVIGWIYWKTQSIWPGIFMHWANNSFGFFLAKKFESINVTFRDVIGNPLHYISLLLLCLFMCYAIYLVLNNYFEKSRLKHNDTLTI